jgi:hypothetical protein
VSASLQFALGLPLGAKYIDQLASACSPSLGPLLWHSLCGDAGGLGEGGDAIAGPPGEPSTRRPC